jgi:hypothetical protein
MGAQIAPDLYHQRLPGIDQLTAQNGGIVRCCHRRVDHAPRSVSDALLVVEEVGVRHLAA